MSTNPDFMEYLCEQLREVEGVSYRKMFGEYGVYCRGKIFALVCDNQFYVKPTEKGAAFLGDPVYAPPYEGAKPYFLITELDDAEYLARLTELTWEELPIPKAKKAKRL
ncbi:TfoX/Sxy family protein [Bacilliculturomica massiliensis]|uniref:TfoX/Sxy family protein n=1 Tax=Bacilliculturomica massiliensis TaxID=1917867 RepID=UPI001030520C|nr:TfoX/Sxy family protein [Bacilliculturomica massiliensis]